MLRSWRWSLHKPCLFQGFRGEQLCGSAAFVPSRQNFLGLCRLDKATTTMTEAVKEGVGLPYRDRNEAWLKLPAPIKRVFDKFPIQTLQENSSPQRVQRKSSRNILYIFNPARVDGPSWNPSCLKWQVSYFCRL